jgi:hypothetical protein
MIIIMVAHFVLLAIAIQAANALVPVVHVHDQVVHLVDVTDRIYLSNQLYDPYSTLPASLRLLK